MRKTRALSSYVAALVLVAITMSLSYVVYEGVREFSTDDQVGVFTNHLQLLQASPDNLLQLVVNSSEDETPVLLEVNGGGSQGSVLYLDGSGGYGTTSSALCLGGATTFFSIFTPSAGLLQVRSDGASWIDGHWTPSLEVQPGWNEVIISDASSCSVVTPTGATVTGPGAGISGVPLTGTTPSMGFTLYVPTDGRFALPQLVLVFSDGGLDRVA